MSDNLSLEEYINATIMPLPELSKNFKSRPGNLSVSQQAQKRASQMQSLEDRVLAYKNYLLPFEGFDPVARRGKGETHLTIGHGHYGPDVKPGQRITKQQAAILLDQDVRKRIPQIEAAIPGFSSFPMSVQVPIFGEFYRGSVGTGESGSPETRRLINAGNFAEAAKEFLRHKEYKKQKAIKDNSVTQRMENVSAALREMAKLSQ